MIIMIIEKDEDSVYEYLIDTANVTDKKYRDFLENTKKKVITRKMQEDDELIESMLEEYGWDDLTYECYKTLSASNWDNIKIEKWITIDL